MKLLAALVPDSGEEENLTGVMGGYGPPWGGPEALSWKEYLRDLWAPDDRPRVTAIRRCIERMRLVGAYGEDVANNFHFRLSDGTRWSFTWRAWGDLMQAIVGKREGYMRYYMCWGGLPAGPIPKEESRRAM